MADRLENHQNGEIEKLADVSIYYSTLAMPKLSLSVPSRSMQDIAGATHTHFSC